MSDLQFHADWDDVQKWLQGDGEYLPPARLLQDLSEAQASAILPGFPHSIAQIVAHMHYYQGQGLARRRGESWPAAEHLEETFATPQPGTWPLLLSDFLGGVEELQTLAADHVSYGYPAAALHNGYHLGQIALLRQMQSLWPPEGGDAAEF